jgi:hypothetical protein
MQLIRLVLLVLLVMAGIVGWAFVLAAVALLRK